MKKQERSGHDIDKAMANAGMLNPRKNKKLQSEEPLAEKDEEKQAEDAQRKRMKNKTS